MISDESDATDHVCSAISCKMWWFRGSADLEVDVVSSVVSALVATPHAVTAITLFLLVLIFKLCLLLLEARPQSLSCLGHCTTAGVGDKGAVAMNGEVY